MNGGFEFAFKCVLMSLVMCTGIKCPQFACYVCPVLMYIEMCRVIGPMFPIKLNVLTIQVKTREGNKKLLFFFFCQKRCLRLLTS